MYMNLVKGQLKFMELPSPILEVPSPLNENDKLLEDSRCNGVTSFSGISDHSVQENHLGNENISFQDGPLSLQDSFNGSTMETDTGQSGKSKDGKSSSQMQKSFSLSSQNEAQNYAEMNGDIEWEELLNVKNLKEDVLLPKVKKIVEALHKVEEYERGDAMRLIKSIGDTYWSYRSLRRKIGDILGDSGFADVIMKMLKDLNAKGIFKNDSIWFPTYYALNDLWNFTDASLSLAKKVAEADGVRFFTVNCSHKPYLEALQNKNVYYVVKSSMSIIHNIARTTGVYQFFKENKTTDIMLSYLNNTEKKDEMLQILAMLTVSHIVEEEENDKLIDDTGAIDATIKFIDLALKSERKRYRGFTPHELMDGLSKLAVNDKNKKKIVDAGALPVFLKMLQSDNEEAQAITARAIWTLAFDKDVCQSVVQFEEMMPTLEKLKDSPNKDVQKNVNGSLFVLKGENDVSGRPKSAKKNKGHVFLSYSWNEKDIVYKLRDKLKSEGFTVWIDVERMGGSTLTAMAEAVENSAVVLVGMSEKYKQSPNCRLEAEYAFQLRKDYIPIMLQKKYRPDGWLGIILGAKLYFDFSGKYPFEKAWQGLLKELKSLGRVHQRPTSNTANPGEIDTTDSPVVLHSSVTTSGAPSAIQDFVISPETLKMSQEQVSDWLCDLKLDGCVPSMAMFDGKLLCQLKRMKTEAPEFYYQSLEKRLGMSLVEILTFTAALDKL